jgi:hypothetical protein
MHAENGYRAKLNAATEKRIAVSQARSAGKSRDEPAKGSV